MKSLISIICTILFMVPTSHLIQAQVTLGTETSIYHLKEKYSFIGENEESYFMRSKAKDKCFFFNFQKSNLSLISKTEYSDSLTKDLSIWYVDIVFIGDKIWLLKQVEQRGSLSSSVYAQELDQTGKFVGSELLVNQFTYTSKYHKSTVTAHLSEDGNHVLLFRDFDLDSKANTMVEAILLDAGLQKVYQKTIELDYRDEIIKYYNIRIDEAGNLYFIGERKYDARRKEYPPSEAQKRKFLIIRYHNEQDLVFENDINIDEKAWISTFEYDFDENNNIFCLGFYSMKGSSKPEGIFYFNLEAGSARDPELIKTIPVDHFNFKSYLNDHRVVYGANQSNRGYHIRKIVRKPDGGMTLITEYCETFNEKTTFNKDILIFNISKNMAVNNVDIIEKTQITAYRDSKSLITLHRDDKPALLFQQTIQKKTMLEMKTINEDGSSSSKTLDSDFNYFLVVPTGVFYNAEKNTMDLLVRSKFPGTGVNAIRMARVEIK